MRMQPLLINTADNTEFELSPETTIGRRDDCNIVLVESRASRFHAQISYIDSTLSIEDFSSNGTTLNGSPITGITRLYHDDILCFDEDQFRIFYPIDISDENKPQPPEPAFSELSDNAIRKPLPARPLDEGTKVVFSQSTQDYAPLDYRSFSSPALVIRNGSLEGKIFSLQDHMHRWSLGSSDDNDIRIADEGVSTNHALLQRNANQWEVIDQMSTNLLRVNGSTTNKRYLSKGDRINLGPIDCDFVLPDGYRVVQKKTGSRRSLLLSLAVGIVVIALVVLIALYFYTAK